MDDTTRLLLGGEWIEIPSILITNDLSFFCKVLNKKSFKSLPPDAQDYLKRYLPKITGQNIDALFESIFSNDKNFCFGNPINKFFEKIQGGYFTTADHVQLRDHKRVLYDHYIRHYQMNLLKDLLINRHTLVERASKLQSAESIKIPPNIYFSQKKLGKYNIIKRRANIRARRMIDDCRLKTDQNPGISSDESDSEIASSAFPIPQNARSTMFVERFSADLDLYQPVRLKDVPELYQEYSYLRETEPDCPSLDISDITLEEVYERTGISFQTERNFSKKNDEQTLARCNGRRFSKYKEKEERQDELIGKKSADNLIHQSK